MPFSDPVADGPTIQRASERALRGGTTLAGVLDLVRRLRAHTQVPLVLFSYFNPILQMGLDKFASTAAKAGADGVLATDLTLEEAGDYRATMHSRALDTIFLVAPTSTDARIVRIASASSGFLYVISRAGVTGAQDALPAELPKSRSARPEIHDASNCGWIRNFSADACHCAWRNRGRGRRGLSARRRNRESHIARRGRGSGCRTNPHAEARRARRCEPPGIRK